MGKEPQHCYHEVTVQGHGATRPQCSLCEHGVSLEPPHMPHALVSAPACPTDTTIPLQQEFGVPSYTPSPTQQCWSQGWHQEDKSLSPCNGSPCMQGTWDQHRQGEHRLPFHHGTGPGLTQAGKEGKMFSSGLFCFGVFCLFPPGQF